MLCYVISAAINKLFHEIEEDLNFGEKPERETKVIFPDLWVNEQRFQKWVE